MTLTAALVLPLGGCGKSDSAAGNPSEDFGTVGGRVDLATYTKAFCRAFEDFSDVPPAVIVGSSAAQEEVDRQGSTSRSVAAKYDAVLIEVAASAAAARMKLSKVGYPDLPDGEALAGRVRELMGIRPLVTDIRSKVDGFHGSAREVVYVAENLLTEFAHQIVGRYKSLTELRDRAEFAASRPKACG